MTETVKEIESMSLDEIREARKNANEEVLRLQAAEKAASDTTPTQTDGDADGGADTPKEGDESPSKSEDERVAARVQEELAKERRQAAMVVADHSPEATSPYDGEDDTLKLMSSFGTFTDDSADTRAKVVEGLKGIGYNPF